MNLKPSRSAIKTGFNMASMTDVIFLLLLFFLLTSSYITPNSLLVHLPHSKYAKKQTHEINVTITKNLEFFIEKEKIAVQDLFTKIQAKIKKDIENTIALHMDRDIAVQNMVDVAEVATKLQAKIVIITTTKKF